MDLSRTRLERLIDEHVFSEVGRRMLKMRWFDGCTYEQIGGIFDRCPRHTRRKILAYELEIIKYL